MLSGDERYPLDSPFHGEPAGYGRSRYAAELMTSTLGTYELFAELSIALAGFSGVASAFGGRNREFSPIEKSRLDAMFQFSGASLGASLLVLTLAEAGMPESKVFSSVCALSGAAILAIACRQLPRVIPLYQDGESTTSRGFLTFAIPYLFGLSIFYFWAAIYDQSSWPLFAGISSQLLWGLWMFARFLLRAQ